MSADSYFQVGQIECVVLPDGGGVIGAERMMKRFPNGDESAFRQAYAAIGLDFDQADSSMNVLLAKVGDQTVLIDSGEGGKPNGGGLLTNMQAAGIAPESVTLVVITHSHGDHVQGILVDDTTAAFPNASYVISKMEMAFWQKRIDEGTAAHAPIVALMQARGLRLIDMDEPILPGVTAVPIPGHTPGQIGILFESNGETLIHLADALHSPMQFAHPEWSPRFDADSTLSVQTRRAVLARCADDHLLTMFYHLTFPGVVRIARAEDGMGFAMSKEGH